MLRNAGLLTFATSALVLTACAAETGTPKGDEGGLETFAVTGDPGAADGRGLHQGEIAIDVTETGELTHRAPYHTWLLAGGLGDAVFVDLASREGDDLLVMLYVEGDSGWELAAHNDDCAGTLNSCLEVTLEHDRDYLVLATTYRYAYFRRPTPASYHLTVHCRSGACAGEEPGGEEGDLCGGIAGLACREGLACDYSGNDFCGPDLAGTCVADEPLICTAHYDPVCGCDGRTYGNDCYRRIAYVALDHRGPCGDEGGADVGETCGGIAAIACRSGLVCDYGANAWDGVCPADEAGVCAEEVVIVCTAEYRPVCGCDGRTYGNDCYRRAARVSLAYAGECR